MARRGAGLSSLQRHLDSSNSYSTLSSTLSSQQAQSLSSQLSTFQSSLSQFSTQHRSRITSSPSLRSHFTQLCAELGVDPLGGGAKGLWDKLGVGDWYYALGVQIVDVCLEARERGGGLVALDEVISAVERLRHAGGRGAAGAKVPPGNEITAEDVRKAIEVLEPLGCGYTLIETGGGRKVVQCYPTGLDRDSLAVVEAASERGRGIVTSEIVWEFKRDEGWTRERATRAVEKALGEGVIWIDEQASGGRQYAVPALYDFGS
jgi:ESCRT-II complex subunit VPS22